MVEGFVKQRDVTRIVVRMNGVRCALAPKWTKKTWGELTKREKWFIFLSHTSLKFFTLRVFMPYFSMLENEREMEELPEFMSRFCDDIQAKISPLLVPFDKPPVEDKRWRICKVWPTGCMKSSLVVACQSWLMGVNPSVTQVAVFSIKELGERIVNLHKSVINECETYRWVFGNLNPSETEGERIWRSDSFTIERPVKRSTASFTIAGYRGSLEGIRVDVGWGDDLVDENNSLTQEARLGQYRWVTVVLERRLHPERRLLVFVGTSHYGDDLYSQCELHSKQEGNWDFERLAMIPQIAIDVGMWPPQKINPDLPYAVDNVIVDPKLPTLWPDFWTPERIVDDYLSSPHAFARTRQNQLNDPDSSIFTEHDLDYCLADGGVDPSGNRKPELVLWRYTDGIPAPGSPIKALYDAAGISIEYAVVTADLAATEAAPGKDPDYTVFQLWGWCRNTRRRVLLDTWRFRTGSPRVMKSRFVLFVQNYLPIVRAMAAEANAVDKLFVGELSDFVYEQLGQRVRDVPLKGEKRELILNFKDLIEDTALWVPYSIQSKRTRREMGVFRQELLDYSETDRGKHDDTLIAGVHHIRLLKSGSFSGGATVVRVGARGQSVDSRYTGLLTADFGDEERVGRTVADEWEDVVRHRTRRQSCRITATSGLQRTNLTAAAFRGG